MNFTNIFDLSKYEMSKKKGSIHSKTLSWQTFEQRRDFFLACNMYKCVKGLAPDRLCNNIEMYFDRHGFNTKNADSLYVVHLSLTWNVLSNLLIIILVLLYGIRPKTHRLLVVLKICISK